MRTFCTVKNEIPQKMMIFTGKKHRFHIRMMIDVPFALRYGGKNDAKRVNYRKEGTLMKKL